MGWFDDDPKKECLSYYTTIELIDIFTMDRNFLAAWGTLVLPDFIRDLISFLNPVQEWLRDHPIFRVSMFWVCGTVIPMIAWLILAFPLVFGKSTRPEPEIKAPQA